MNKSLSAILLLIMSLSTSIADELKILEFETGMKTTDIQCKFKEKRNSMTLEFTDYNCQIQRSKTDILEFSSDPFSNIVGTVERHILISNTDRERFKDKAFEHYGKPTKTEKDPLFFTESFEWGNVPNVHIFVNKEAYYGVKQLLVRITHCQLTDCEIFGEHNEKSYKVWFLLIDYDLAAVNSASLKKESDQTDFVFAERYGETQKTPTEDVNDLKF